MRRFWGRSPRGSVDRNRFKDWIDYIASRVAPRAGAWIETGTPTGRGAAWWSLPARERGSKLRRRCRGRKKGRSLPARERGSKRLRCARPMPVFGSLPARERGSKHHSGAAVRAVCGRSPRGSVDRNMPFLGPLVERARRRSPRGSVDRNTDHRQRRPVIVSRSPRGSVDRNATGANQPLVADVVAPRAGAWIETCC